MECVVFDLEFSSAESFVDCPLHAVGDGIGVEYYSSIDIAGGAANGLDEAGFAAEEAFLVGIHDGNKRDFREVKSFAKQIDTDNGIMPTFAEFAEYLDAFDGIEF